MFNDNLAILNTIRLSLISPNQWRRFNSFIFFIDITFSMCMSITIPTASERERGRGRATHTRSICLRFCRGESIVWCMHSIVYTIHSYHARWSVSQNFVRLGKFFGYGFRVPVLVSHGWSSVLINSWMNEWINKYSLVNSFWNPLAHQKCIHCTRQK